LGTWPRTYLVVILLHAAWIALLLFMTLRWNRPVPS